MTQTQLTLSDIYSTDLAPMNEAKAAIHRETNPSTVADLGKRFEALRAIDSRNFERRNYWAELAIWSNRRLGEMLVMAQEEGTLAKPGGNRIAKAHDGPLTIGDIGIDRHQAQRAQKLAAIPEETIKAFVEHQRVAGDEVSKAGLGGVDAIEQIVDAVGAEVQVDVCQPGKSHWSVLLGENRITSAADKHYTPRTAPSHPSAKSGSCCD